jgi:hypothetical protein
VKQHHRVRVAKPPVVRKRPNAVPSPVVGVLVSQLVTTTTHTAAPERAAGGGGRAASVAGWVLGGLLAVGLVIGGGWAALEPNALYRKLAAR